MNQFLPIARFALALLLPVLPSSARAADDSPCTTPALLPIVEQPQRTSWVFMRSRYTHDPVTGARVAQYAMKPPVEPLDDPRQVTSGYSRSRVVMRGPDGTVDTSYRVQSYGNGRGGLDAEWERFHDAWRGSTVGGGSYQGFAPLYGGFPGFGYPYGGFGGGVGGQVGFPGFRYPPGYNYQNGPLVEGGSFGYGPGYGAPDAGRLDPDGADGNRERLPRTPDREFYNRHVPGGQSAR